MITLGRKTKLEAMIKEFISSKFSTHSHTGTYISLVKPLITVYNNMNHSEYGTMLKIVTTGSHVPRVLDIALL